MFSCEPLQNIVCIFLIFFQLFSREIDGYYTSTRAMTMRAIWSCVFSYRFNLERIGGRYQSPLNPVAAAPLTHLCPPLRSTFAVRETASLGIMGDITVGINGLTGIIKNVFHLKWNIFLSIPYLNYGLHQMLSARKTKKHNILICIAEVWLVNELIS